LVEEYLKNRKKRDDLNRLMQQSAKPDFLKTLDRDILEKCREYIKPLFGTGKDENGVEINILPNHKQLEKLQKALDKRLGSTDA